MSPELSRIKALIEATLFVATRPMSAEQLAKTVLADYSVPVKAIESVLQELGDDYRDRGVYLQQTASGYRFQTQQELAGDLSRLWQEKAPRYSRATIETLALIAYRQPITRGEIEAVRGVSVSSTIMTTLKERGWIRIVGHKEVPGRPALYATTKTFLDYFNMQQLEQLPELDSEMLAKLSAIEQSAVSDS
ncbi:SMC-Scp complex subunit ScpB [Dongshaea marina]|uniref:SMC-Scp complex subunit ScpB n=1 Tax=Dongshaea marina TaxID=2047966 RepID=UPI000D3EADD8|nr:SMC-Scp complex subunit ScpB [Dongshaea marina]